LAGIGKSEAAAEPAEPRSATKRNGVSKKYAPDTEPDALDRGTGGAREAGHHNVFSSLDGWPTQVHHRLLPPRQVTPAMVESLASLGAGSAGIQLLPGRELLGPRLRNVVKSIRP
jgi:hypothetical protein